MTNSRTLREASVFGLNCFSKLRAPGFAIHCYVDGKDAVADVREAVSFGPMRQYAFDVVLLTMTHIAARAAGLRRQLRGAGGDMAPIDRADPRVWDDVMATRLTPPGVRRASRAGPRSGPSPEYR